MPEKGMRAFAVFALAAFLASACARRSSSGYQGYLEGEFVAVASPLSGQLEQLPVAKGAFVAAGAPLFSLEHAAELAAQEEAANRLRSAQARLEDLKKGARPSELATLEARLNQARATAEQSKLDLARQELLFKNQVIAENELDRARLTHERNLKTVDEISTQLATARLGARSDAISAAEAEVSGAAAAKERADWNVAQKTKVAPRAALVYDTLYREGEFVTAGTPVVLLLPPEYLKVRFFVPETEFAALKTGDRVRVSVSGRPPIEAHVTYLSPKPEYSPPVLYNRDNRSKLVYMIEAAIEGDAARELHPGQPVDVTPAP
jgi:HlyD family secretion protein